MSIADGLADDSTVGTFDGITGAGNADTADVASASGTAGAGNGGAGMGLDLAGEGFLDSMVGFTSGGRAIAACSTGGSASVTSPDGIPTTGGRSTDAASTCTCG
jgi:hypothetical protein